MFVLGIGQRGPERGTYRLGEPPHVLGVQVKLKTDRRGGRG